MLKFTIFLAAIWVNLLLVLASSTLTEKDEANLLRNYEKLNQYLRDNEKTNKIEPNMERVQRWIQTKVLGLTSVAPNSLGVAFKQFGDLQLLLNRSMCHGNQAKEILLYNDHGLNRKFISWDNHPLRRIDRLVQYFALKYAKLCPNSYPNNLIYAYKSDIYDQIDSYLEERVPNDELAPNMAKAAKWLESKVAKNTRGGSSSLLDALNQFTSLQSLLNADSCKASGHETLLKNDLATRVNRHQSAPRGNKRRIERVIDQYFERHAELCRDIYPQNFRNIVKQLDSQTLRVAEVLANQFLDSMLYKTFADHWFRLADSHVESDWVDLLAIKYAADESWLKSETQLVLSSLKLLAKEEPEAKYLAKVVDPKKKRLVVDGEKVRGLFSRLLVAPCENYVYLSGRDVFYPADYDATSNADYWDSPLIEGGEKEFIATFGYKLGHVSFQICDILLRNQDFFVDKLIKSIE